METRGPVFSDTTQHSASVSLYDFKGHNVRVTMIGGEPWFAAADVRAILNLSRGGKQNYLLKDEIRRELELNGVKLKGHGLAFITESGLYKMVLRSNKPEAKEFQSWVTRVVLPSIRKDGGYIHGEEHMMTEAPPPSITEMNQ